LNGVNEALLLVQAVKEEYIAQFNRYTKKNRSVSLGGFFLLAKIRGLFAFI